MPKLSKSRKLLKTLAFMAAREYRGMSESALIGDNLTLFVSLARKMVHPGSGIRVRHHGIFSGHIPPRTIIRGVGYR
jgi:hypothetical protein